MKRFDFSGPISPNNGPINMISSGKVVVDVVVAMHFALLNHYDQTIIGLIRLHKMQANRR